MCCLLPTTDKCDSEAKPLVNLVIAAVTKPKRLVQVSTAKDKQKRLSVGKFSTLGGEQSKSSVDVT